MKRDTRGGYGLLFGLFLILILIFVLCDNDLSQAIDMSLGIIDPATTVPVLGGGAPLSRLGLY